MTKTDQSTKNMLRFSFSFLLILTSCESQGIEEPEQEMGEIPFEHIVIDSNNPPHPHCKTVGDINGDDFPDVLAASAGGDTTGLFWYEYPDWTKHKISSGSFTTDMQVADIDNDGDLDPVLPKINGSGFTIVWYENPRPGGSPEGEWKEHEIADAGAHDVEVNDLNKDGKLDVVVRLGDVSVLLQESPETWTKITIPEEGRSGLNLEDIDRDGRIDLVLDGYWLKAPADPRSGTWEKYYFAKDWEGIEVGVTPVDLNNDNRTDIIVAPSESSGRLVWYEAPADPVSEDQWTEHAIDSPVSYLHTFKVADMDLDGDIDIVTAEMHQSENRRVTVYLNEEESLNWRPQVISTTGSHNIRVVDIDNDGDMDIVGANWNNDSPTNGAIELWRNNLRTR